MIELGPVVNSVPTATIVRRLVFFVNSLIEFGTSHISPTVSSEVYDFVEHCRFALDAFPYFIGLADQAIQVPEHALV
jgi:hypothetical protein